MSLSPLPLGDILPVSFGQAGHRHGHQLTRCSLEPDPAVLDRDQFRLDAVAGRVGPEPHGGQIALIPALASIPWFALGTSGMYFRDRST